MSDFIPSDRAVETDGKPKSIHHHLVLDASGSMETCYRATLEALNEQYVHLGQLAQEHPDIPVEVALNSFANDVVLHHDLVPAAELKPLTERDYQLRGMTALWDGMGDAIDLMVARLGEDVVERGGVACVMILTDGYENASVRHTAAGIRKRVERLRERGWDFRIIGAGINPMEMAKEAGLELDEIVAFEGDDAEDNMRDSLGYMGDYFRNCY